MDEKKVKNEIKNFCNFCISSIEEIKETTIKSGGEIPSELVSTRKYLNYSEKPNVNASHMINCINRFYFRNKANFALILQDSSFLKSTSSCLYLRDLIEVDQKEMIDALRQSCIPLNSIFEMIENYDKLSGLAEKQKQFFLYLIRLVYYCSPDEHDVLFPLITNLELQTSATERTVPLKENQTPLFPMADMAKNLASRLGIDTSHISLPTNIEDGKKLVTNVLKGVNDPQVQGFIKSVKDYLSENKESINGAQAFFKNIANEMANVVGNIEASPSSNEATSSSSS
jgi:hypothetical protein